MLSNSNKVKDVEKGSDAHLNKKRVRSVRNKPPKDSPMPMKEIMPRIFSCVSFSAATLPAYGSKMMAKLVI